MASSWTRVKAEAPKNNAPPKLTTDSIAAGLMDITLITGAGSPDFFSVSRIQDIIVSSQLEDWSDDTRFPIPGRYARSEASALRIAIPITLIIGLVSIACSNGSVTAPATIDTATPLPSVTPAPTLNPTETPSVPQEYQVTVSTGQDTEVATAFCPSRLTIRAGDAVTWVLNSDEIHTVTFFTGTDLPEFVVPIPGAEPGIVMLNPLVAFPTRLPTSPVETIDGTRLVNSGILSKDAPTGRQPNDSLTVRFNTTGAFEYICAIHGPLMQGAVIVLEGITPNMLTPQQVETAAATKLEGTSAKFESVRQQFQLNRTEPGPGETDIWFVGAGGSGIVDPRIQIYEFFPNELTVKSGDTVVWGP